MSQKEEEGPMKALFRFHVTQLNNCSKMEVWRSCRGLFVKFLIGKEEYRTSWFFKSSYQVTMSRV